MPRDIYSGRRNPLLSVAPPPPRGPHEATTTANRASATRAGLLDGLLHGEPLKTFDALDVLGAAGISEHTRDPKWRVSVIVYVFGGCSHGFQPPVNQ